MSIVSFWSSGTEESGKSSAIVSLATLLTVNHNYKILILDTKYNDLFYQDCFWKEDKTIKRINGGMRTDLGSGISGLTKAILSNKTSPEIVTNYTKIVFKDRLELLMDTESRPDEYKSHTKIFKDIIKISNKYYDFVFVDIDSSLDLVIKDSILENSDLVVACMPQRIRKINEYIKTKAESTILKNKLVIPLLGRYDKNSKYNEKNVARYLKEKRGVCVIPYNTLFMEACNEATVADYFIKFRKINIKDKNAVFISEVNQSAEKIISCLQELQMRM